MAIQDVPVSDLIEKAAEELKKVSSIKPPAWAAYVKTGANKERPPVRNDWWHVRSAAVLRSVARLGPVGVSKLRTKYGGKKNRGHKPERFYKGSGNILRKILQQMEAAQLLKKSEKGTRKGRIITPKGRSLLAKAALEASKLMVKEKKSQPEAKKEDAKAEKKEEKPKQEAKPEVKKEKVEQKQGIKKPEVKKEETQKPEAKKEEKKEGPKAEEAKPEEKPNAKSPEAPKQEAKEKNE